MKSNDKLSDEKLVELVRSQDKEAYADIVYRYQEKLLRYANYILADDQLSQDIVQTAFIKAYQNLYGFDTKKKFSSWIYRIVHNEAINTIKKNKKTILLETDHWHQISSNENLEDNYNQKELKEAIRKSVNKLSVKYKAPISLFYLEDRSYEEISDILKLPISTVGTRISRAKSLLKTILEKGGSHEQ